MSTTRAREIFMELVAHVPPEQWPGRLAELAGQDAELHAKVARLLAAHGQADSFLEHPAPSRGGTVDGAPASAAPAGSLAETEVTERPGTVLGPYKLLEQIGEGGFGIVFMAEQQHPVRRKVALKVLKPGMDTRQVVVRFEAERQALALMDHPNIAQVFDGGETASGRPYFVMELVRGIPITDFCDQNHLSVRERLELYVTVCQAVQHAHQKGIIHRDLKPSNILVTLHDDKAVVKTIDFGIAKATGQQLTEKTLFTNFAQLIGTPLYMSPEQAQLNGLDIDTRSDIYSLGVLLYELLTGTTPFDKERLRTVAFDEIRRIIREEEPAKPSTRISTLGQAATTVSANRKSDPRRLVQLCRGELDWIVMKALEKDRNRRYDSASAFAADVQHYLHDEPVQACPPSAWYRFCKFARRNKRAAVMASFVLVLLVGAVAVLGVSYAQVQEALQEKTQAFQGEREALQEKTLTTYLQSIALAERQLAAGNVGRAEELLNGCPPELCGWEWHFLKRQRYGNALVLQHMYTCAEVAFSPDGLQIACAAFGRQLTTGPLDLTIKIWDARTGGLAYTLREKGEHPTYSSDGRYLAVACANEVVRVLKPRTGESLARVPGHWPVAFSPDCRTLATTSQGRSVKLWDMSALDKGDIDRPIRTLSEHPADVAAMIFSPDGGRLLAACEDGAVTTWDVATGQQTCSFHAQFEYGSRPYFSPDARRLAWACWDGVVKVWDTATGHKDLDLQGNQHWSRSVAFSPDGRRIALAGFDGTIRLLDASTGRETLTIYAHPSLVADVAFSPDGYRLASSSYDHTVRIWDATPLTGVPQSGQCVTLTGHTQQVDAVAFSPNGRWLASGSRDRTVNLWELSGNSAPALRYTLRGHRGYIRDVAFSSDNRTLATGGMDNTVKLWDLQAPQGDSLTEWRTIRGDFICSLAFSPDGRLLAIGQGGGIGIYDPATGKEVYPFKRTPAGVPALAFGPDGRLYSCGASDPTIKVWDVAGQKPIRTILHYSNPNSTVAVSPDGRLIASAGRDRTGHLVKLWDAKSGTEWRRLHGHAHYVWKVAFSPDSRYVASGSWDSTVKVWDLKASESEEPVTLRGHAGFILSLAFSPDGRHLASASGYPGYGEVKVWDASLWDHQAK
jgi:WD40 repeat protein/serine/threonine protein kinase